MEFCLGVEEIDVLLVGDWIPFTFCMDISSGVFPFVCLTEIFDWSIDRVENLSDNEEIDFLRLIGKLGGLGLLVCE